MTFASLHLSDPLLRSLQQESYRKPTPIQQQAIPHVLAGRDLLATAQTGTGKTAAFALPMLQLLSGRKNRSSIGALVLTPTRELALQIDESFRTYGRYMASRSTVVLGGVPAGTQILALRRRPDILVATPGRLLDLMAQGHVRLQAIEILVLDEADRMLDMGFIHDVRRVVDALPTRRQTMLFSATLSKEIADLASDMLRQPVRAEVTPAASVSDHIDQQVCFVEHDSKRDLLAELLRTGDIHRALVFTRTKRRANRVMKQLCAQGIAADAIHADKKQAARQQALASFGRGRIKVLVATDIVARGIDVEDISHVINYDLPTDPKNYVHRIGRTARAGMKGIALSFCAADEFTLLKSIEKLTRVPLTIQDMDSQRPRCDGSVDPVNGTSRPARQRNNKTQQSVNKKSNPTGQSHKKPPGFGRNRAATQV